MTERDSDALQQVIEQVRELRQALARQEERMVAQQEIIRAQQAEIGTLRAQGKCFPASNDDEATRSNAGALTTRLKRGTSSSRRALLKWGGAATAAATAALVIGEGRRVRAASANDGDAIIAGQGTTATSTTYLHNNVSTSPNPLLYLDNTYPSGAGNTVQAYCMAGFTALYGRGFGNGGGVHGLSDNGGIGVFGESGGIGTGVLGTSTSGYGVYGQSGGAGVGVFGQSSSG
ncbi:MAG TPA: hypothetical protein VF120_10975 [Ktedonobacterales bacterium]